MSSCNKEIPTKPYPTSAALKESHGTSPINLSQFWRHWHLCEALVHHFQKRWQSEYSKWYQPVKYLQVGDIFVLREDNAMPS